MEDVGSSYRLHKETVANEWKKQPPYIFTMEAAPVVLQDARPTVRAL
jgi:hypothetical protein